MGASYVTLGEILKDYSPKIRRNKLGMEIIQNIIVIHLSLRGGHV
jgi:thiamine monophosphate synthase